MKAYRLTSHAGPHAPSITPVGCWAICPRAGTLEIGWVHADVTWRVGAAGVFGGVLRKRRHLGSVADRFDVSDHGPIARSRISVSVGIACSLIALAGCSGETTNETSATPTPAPPSTEAQQGEAVTTDSPQRITYGEAPEQFGDLYLPDSESGAPVVVLVHGGFWRAQYGLDLMVPLAEDLVDRGYAVWNIEYRRVGQPGGGYPGTLDDVAAAINELPALAESHSLDLDRVAFVGHSAGGHSALWAGGAGLDVVPHVAIGQGPVVGLGQGGQRGARERCGRRLSRRHADRGSRSLRGGDTAADGRTADGGCGGQRRRHRPARLSRSTRPSQARSRSSRSSPPTTST